MSFQIRSDSLFWKTLPYCISSIPVTNEYLLAVGVCRSVVESGNLLLIFGFGCIVSHNSHQLQGVQNKTTLSHWSQMNFYYYFTSVVRCECEARLILANTNLFISHIWNSIHVSPGNVCSNWHTGRAASHGAITITWSSMSTKLKSFWWTKVLQIWTLLQQCSKFF